MINDPKIRAILGQFDQAADVYDFPMLDNQNFDPAGVQLSAFSNGEHYALFIEVLWTRVCPCTLDDFCGGVLALGNCLAASARAEGLVFRPLIEGGPNCPLLAEDAPYVDPESRTVVIRGRTVPIEARLEAYRHEGIVSCEATGITGVALLRWLAPRYRDLLFATDEELYSRMTERLPLILRLDEWHHPDLARREKPSDTECFKQIAEVLATSDPSKYRPTEPPNTHWSNWLNK